MSGDLDVPGFSDENWSPYAWQIHQAMQDAYRQASDVLSQNDTDPLQLHIHAD